LYHVYEGAYPFDSLVTKNEIGDPKQTVGFLAVGFSGMLVEIETVGLSPTISVKLPPFIVPQLLVTETVKILPLSDALALAICNIWRGSATSKIATALAAEKSRLRKLRAR
jgi:hypothetical protein